MLASRSILVACAVALAGCASLNSVTSDVSTYGDWPAGRKPGSYAFERLPSQQARADQQAQLETAARSALAKSGFTPAAEGAQPDYIIQLGARTSRSDRSPWDDPFWGRWGGGYGRYPGWHGYGYGYGWGYPGRFYDTPSYEREVALLIRDARTEGGGKPLYEAHASSDGNTLASTAVLSAMYEAAMKDFPTPALSPRSVSVQLPPSP